MIQFSVQHYSKSAAFALMASITTVAMLFGAFFLAEPTMSHAQLADTSDEFSISQVVTDETAFLVQPSDVTTSGSISGVTGGNASGTTEFSVISNNSTGYYVNITFENNGTSQTMIGDLDADESIVDYEGDIGSEPSYGYTTSASAQFAYTVTSDTPTDTAQSFLNNSSACNQSGGSQNGATKATKCWKEPMVTPFEIVNRSNAAVTGATSTLEFDITIPSNPVPVPTAQTYTATATLTLFTQ
jgi:hypothetical protein